MSPRTHHRSARRGALVPTMALATLTAAGCGSGELATTADAAPPSADAATDPTDAAPRWTSLADPNAWELVEAADDPFDDRPADVVCPPIGRETEALPEVVEGVGGYPGQIAYIVHTDDCNYHTARQPTLVSLAPGDPLRVRLWHFALIYDQPAQGHAAVWLGDELIWDATYSIPQSPGLTDETVILTRAVPAGTPLYYHLHNHGANTWSLWEISTEPRDARGRR